MAGLRQRRGWATRPAVGQHGPSSGGQREVDALAVLLVGLPRDQTLAIEDRERLRNRPARDPDPVPLTMQAYAMRGTPTLVVVGPDGRIRLHAFGRVEDLVVGALILRLMAGG